MPHKRHRLLAILLRDQPTFTQIGTINGVVPQKQPNGVKGHRLECFKGGIREQSAQRISKRLPAARTGSMVPSSKQPKIRRLQLDQNPLVLNQPFQPLVHGVLGAVT
jgi:hypothetical protein